ncbi:acyltransferase [Luteimonas sp. MC1895]|uniref:acyltransferase family protein n=1 Tax=Luteimonas sp. MC1895 TaxID=2819513 RepID=UPI0018F0F349|nr:acyltransferase [Luteimonas sp. MC1895]MBJ6978097.1 acyltransferase [Luteimonas sp. MC1895]
MMSVARTKKLEGLEALRGFAALWVLLVHANQATTHFVNWDAGAAGQVIANGFLGVDFFFVLSGFIIAFTSQRLADRGGGFRAYAQARLLRIYVPYLPIGIGIYLLYILLPGLSEAERSPGLLTSFALLPSNSPPALSVAWTLVHELIFYAVFSVWFVSRRVLWALLGVWAGAIAAVWMQDVELSRFAGYFLSPLNLCFLLGVAVYRISRRLRTAGGAKTALALAMGGLVAVCLQALQLEPVRFWVAIGFGAIVLAASMPAGARVRIWRPLMVLGAASYAVYLIHNPLLSVAVRVAVKVGVQGWAAFLLISAVALAGGLMYWALYERRALGLTRRWLTGRKAREEIQRSVGSL